MKKNNVESVRNQSSLSRMKLRILWGLRNAFGMTVLTAGVFFSVSSHGAGVPVCGDCALPRQPGSPQVYVKSPVSVNQGTVIQKIVFQGAEVRHDFAVRAGKKYFVYLLPHSGNPDLGVSSSVINPFVMPDWQWMPKSGSAFEGTVITPRVSGLISTKVRGKGEGFSSYSLAIFER